MLFKDKGSCWLWQGTTDKDGYGIFCFEYTIIKAHRFSYIIHKGAIPSYSLVLHTCDIPSCCNPEHLYLGTQQDNMTDRTQRHREAHNNGVKNGRCKLSELQITEIRRLRFLELSTVIIAKQFGVSHQQISRICNQKERKMEYV
jgi:hypothetical protein